MTTGYYRFPTIHQDTIVFVCEDDLWTVSAAGGQARRLTANVGMADHPKLSPDGSQIAFVGREEGYREVYVMPANGGPSQRLTFLGDGMCQVVGWTPNGRILFRSAAQSPFFRMERLFTVDPAGGESELLNVGPATTAAYGDDGVMVIGRFNRIPARWKRYRGGRAGAFWLDATGEGEFAPLLDNIGGNLTSPMWANGRFYFLSDHGGISNLYSCTPTADELDLQQHTNHDQFYARDAHSDGQRIVYSAGGDLYFFDPATNDSTKLEIDVYASQSQLNRKFSSAAYYLNDYDPHPEGHSLAITTRGKPFTFANWEGAAIQHGEPDGIRYRLLRWLNDGQRLIGVSDESGEERFVIFTSGKQEVVKTLPELDMGRPLSLDVSPQKDAVLFSNHRYELCHLDLETETLTVIDQGYNSRISGFDWSPDGNWVAYSLSISSQRAAIRLWEVETGQTTTLTDPVLRDSGPSFDPNGRYLYFLSYRHYNPVFDSPRFDLHFPHGSQPYLITLQKETPSPFVPVARAPGKRVEQRDNPMQPVKVKEDEKSTEEGAEEEKKEEAKKPTAVKLRIDLDGIQNRIIKIPVRFSTYGSILGLKNNKILYTRYAIQTSLPRRRNPSIPSAKANLYSYDLHEGKEDSVVTGITSYDLSRNKEVLVYRAGNRLRMIKADTKPSGSGNNRTSGWIDLERAKVSIVPAREWQQMYREAWRLQRDQFWTPDMSQVDWLAAYERYLPLLDRISSRDELSDLLGEMQGELGTSHTYEYGGDYRFGPFYSQGKLGADFSFDAESESWQISHIVQGDIWNEKTSSPLLKPGIDIGIGDRIVAINGRSLSPTYSPRQALVSLGGETVALTVARDDAEPRTFNVKALRSETDARYREWVEGNRRQVHKATNGRIGYIHIPNMGPEGFAEFYRSYLAEVERDGLLIDVRYNGGGNVSQLLLEKLTRRPLGYRPTRWGKQPDPYPNYAINGPLVALTNQNAASDGDIFSHVFKQLGLGPLVGKRTWGGVVGIWPRHSLVDKTTTTQPEFSTWFNDVGWGIENYGAEPDIEIDNSPQDYANGRDAQLERAIAETLALLAENPPETPDFGERPDLSFPKLT